jgi:MOSC domain-containing protein YiiM
VGRIEQILIAPGAAAQMQSVTSVEALADCGLRGDRYASAGSRNDPARQVTFIEIEQIEAFARETGLPLSTADARRNIVTRGIGLNCLVGKRFHVADCEFEGIELCEPCASFVRRTHREIARFFVPRGGLNARIVTGGMLFVGSPIRANAREDSVRG